MKEQVLLCKSVGIDSENITVDMSVILQMEVYFKTLHTLLLNVIQERLIYYSLSWLYISTMSMMYIFDSFGVWCFNYCGVCLIRRRAYTVVRVRKYAFITQCVPITRL